MKAQNRLVIGYVRVSTGKQELSVDAQETRIRGNAMSNGTRLDEVIVDRESAKDLKRDGMERILEMIKGRKVKALIVCKLDRLTRSVRDLSNLIEMFDKYDTALVSIAETLDTKTATGRMMTKLIGLFSEWERETIGERTQTALAHKKGLGERLGNVPYGFTAPLNQRDEKGKTVVAGKLAVNPVEWKIIEEMQMLRSDGKTYREVAEELNRRGHRIRNGQEWRLQYVAGVLASAKEREANQ